MSREHVTEDELLDLTLSELLKLGARFEYREPTEEEKKDRLLLTGLILEVILPGKIHDVDIECKLHDD